MFLSIGRSLRRGFSFRFGFRLKGWMGGIMAIMYAMFYLCWWCMLGAAYIIYGVCYVCYYLPIKGIVKLVKNRRRTQNHYPVNPTAPAPIKPSVAQETYVFLTTKGKKFHYDPYCSSIVNSKTIKMDISKARKAGYKACDKCCYSYLHND